MTTETLLTQESVHLKPIYKKLLGDTETPLSIYFKLAQGKFGSYLLESVVGGENWARYSIVGLGVSEWLKVFDNTVEIWQDGHLSQSHNVDNPLDFIQELQQKITVERCSSLPKFNGGWVGYFSYETIKYIEKKLASKPAKQDEIGAPDCLLSLSTDLVVFDNHNNQLFLLTHAYVDDPESEKKALEKLQHWQEQLNNPLPKQSNTTSNAPKKQEKITHYLPEEQYKQSVAKIKDYILAGDTMQVVLSQQQSMPYYQPPINLYRSIRQINPSPYMYFIEYGDFQIVGASPEILVRMEDDIVTVRPIAGTRKRGKDKQEDLKLEQELLNDEKELAEHLMLIDLGRNDIGRLCQSGTVEVTDQMFIERYSHVMHIVSNVNGTVKPGTHPIDALKATFPAGTLSGAPKVRALEIIDELEKNKRGVYGGAIGYIGWHNNIDTAIAIRTAIIKNNTLYAQAGAGIVADSVEEKEWEETINKAAAIFTSAKLSNTIES